MAKINLLTIHYGRCYGAVMQTYATCKLLENAGHKVTVINLINPSEKGKYTTIFSLLNLIREFQFWRFKKKYFSKMTSKVYSINDLKLPEADIWVVGSDQVWNRDINQNFGLTFYLDFIKDKKKIAFCSSFGKKEWIEDAEYTKKVKDYLDDFTSISVREQSGCDILNDVFHLSSIRLLDPTLEYGLFDNFVKHKVTKHQIFSFLLIPKDSLLNFISEELNIPILRHNRYTSIFKRGPIDWLNNIYQSELVITDSFHGLALSILFKKQFIVFCANEKKFTRLSSLLNLLGLESKYVKSKEDFLLRREDILAPINYNIVNRILNEEREKCKNYIQTNII